MLIDKIKLMKGKEKISVVTCYDYSFACAIREHVDIILVGDSLGNVVLGFDRTKDVSMQDMISHLQAVRRGAPENLIVCDLPYGSYENKDDALKNAKVLIESGADAVKPEGRADIVEILVKARIPVMGHVGLLPQTAKKLGKVGKSVQESENILEEAKSISKAGAFAIVLESIPSNLALKITDEVDAPTIGIGSGQGCDGQVLVLYDLVGLYPDFVPIFARRYLNLQSEISKAVENYSRDVKIGKFPS